MIPLKLLSPIKIQNHKWYSLVNEIAQGKKKNTEFILCFENSETGEKQRLKLFFTSRKARFVPRLPLSSSLELAIILWSNENTVILTTIQTTSLLLQRSPTSNVKKINGFSGEKYLSFAALLIDFWKSLCQKNIIKIKKLKTCTASCLTQSPLL